MQNVHKFIDVWWLSSKRWIRMDGVYLWRNGPSIELECSNLLWIFLMHAGMVGKCHDGSHYSVWFQSDMTFEKKINVVWLGVISSTICTKIILMACWKVSSTKLAIKLKKNNQPPIHRWISNLKNSVFVVLIESAMPISLLFTYKGKKVDVRN